MGSHPGEHEDTAIPGWALLAALVPFAAVGLEYGTNLLGSGIATDFPGWLVTVAWPRWLRVAWWLLAACGAFLLTRGMARAAGRPRWVLSGVVTAPFLGFAGGIAAQASWAAWH